MKTIAIIYLVVVILDIIVEPFYFGTSRPDRSPATWLAGIIFRLPLLYLLFKLI